jgi:hypothetical protein
MPWTTFPDPDDTLHDWLKSLYPAFRNLQVDPSVLPHPDLIGWDEYWAGTYDTSFLVLEETTEHRNLGLGVKNLEFIATNIVRVTYRYIGGDGKPAVIKLFREFVVRTLHENTSPLPSALTSAGIVQIYMPGITSRIAKETKSAQEDFWTLEVRITTKVLNTIV